MKESGREETGWIDSLVWLLCMQWLHVIWLEQRSQWMHMTQICRTWHGRLSMSCSDSLKEKWLHLMVSANFPSKHSHLPTTEDNSSYNTFSLHWRAFVHLLLINHWTAWTQTSATADSTHSQSDPGWKNGFTMRECGSKKFLFHLISCMQRMTACFAIVESVTAEESGRSRAGTKTCSFIKAKWIAYNTII